MKTLRSILLVAAASILAVGCTTTSTDGTGVVTPQRVRAVSTLAAYTSFKMQLIRDPASRPALERIRTGVNELKASETWDVGTLSMILVANSGQLSSDEGQLVLVGVPLFIDLVHGQQVDLKQYEYGRAAIEGVSAGFNLALGSSAPASRAASGDATLTDLQRQARQTR